MPFREKFCWHLDRTDAQGMFSANASLSANFTDAVLIQRPRLFARVPGGQDADFPCFSFDL